MKKVILSVLFVLQSLWLLAQTEEQLIQNCIQRYLLGSSYNLPDSISSAFYADANLFLSSKDKPVWIMPAADYAKLFKKEDAGKFNGRIGRIVSIDIYNDIATAKAEILIPERKLEFMDVFLLKKISGQWKIISKAAASKPGNKSGRKVLFILTNTCFYGNTTEFCGNSFPEIVFAHNAFVTAGYTVDFVSPEGGSIPLEYARTSVPLQKQYLYDQDFMYALEHTLKPGQVNYKDYKAVQFIGGGCAIYGVPENKEIQQIAMQVYEENGGIISSVCHGTAGLVNLKTRDGNYLVKGKTVSGWPEAYESKDALYFKQFPFLIQQTIEARGGKFTYAGRDDVHVEADGRVVTGQNYNSSDAVAKKIIELIEKSN